MRDITNIGDILRNMFPQLYETFFPEPPPLTQKEKQEIIDNLNGVDAGKKIDANMKMINITFNILQSAIGGVMFQYYRDYTENNASPNSLEDVEAEFSDKNASIMTGLAICIATSMALVLAQGYINSIGPKSHKISENIKGAVGLLTPELLREGIAKIENGDESALQIKVPHSLDSQSKLYASYMMSQAVVSASSISEDQQYLLYAASLSMAKFMIGQFEKKIYKTSSIGKRAGDFVRDTFLNILPTAARDGYNAREQTPIPSILGKEVVDSFSAEEMRKISLSIKHEMEKVLEQGCKKDSADFFTTISKTFSFFIPVHHHPGSKILTGSAISNDHFASALDFIIGSIGYNVSQLIGENILAKCGGDKVRPVNQEEINKLNVMENAAAFPYENLPQKDIVEDIEHDIPSRVISPTTSRPSSPKTNNNDMQH